MARPRPLQPAESTTVKSGEVGGDKPAALSRPGMLLGIVLLWTCIAHGGGLYGTFVFDDKALTDDTSLLEFFSFDWFRLTKRPVTTGTFAIHFSLMGPSPFACHVVNLAIHLAATAMLFLLVRRTVQLGTRDIKLGDFYSNCIATLTALLWGVHPLTTAAVTYIVQRSESLASLCILASLYAWSVAFAPSEQGASAEPKSPSTKAWATLAVVAAYVAYGSKEMAAGLPLIILFYDRAFLATSWRSLKSRWPGYALLVAPLVIGVVILLPRIRGASHGRNTIGFNLERFPPHAYLASQPRVFLHYLQLTFFPIGQALDYGWLPPLESRPRWIGTIAWCGILAAITWSWRRSKRLTFPIITALLVLAPTSTILPFQDIIFEHRFYLPSACVLGVAIGIIGTRIARDGTLGRISLTTPLILCAVIATVLSLLTINRNLDYVSKPRMYESDTQANPNNPRPWYGLAITAPFDRPEPKIAMLQHAIELSQERQFFYSGTDYQWNRDLADTMFLAGYIAESRKVYADAFEHCYNDQQRAEIQFRLAMVASMTGDNELANELFEKALATDSIIRDEIKAAYRTHRDRVMNTAY